MILPTLYKATSGGKLQQWQGSTTSAAIVIVYGQVGGKLQTSSFNAVPKNVGRSNSTTAEEQAELELAALWKKQKDKGYFETKEDAQAVIDKETRILLPMLAHSIDDIKSIEYPVDVQPKLDGVRALALKENGIVRLISRQGKLYETVPHINKALEEILPEGHCLDGEIYLHGVGFQAITRLVKKVRPESVELQYWVYDYPLSDKEDYCWEERESILCELEDSVQLPLQIVPTYASNDRASITARQKTFVFDGYEGAIVRLRDGLYTWGHRSRSLLKVKSFLEDDYVVTGVTEGKGKFVGCAIWICKTKDGATFNVTPKCSQEEKQEYYRNREESIGQLAKVKYFELSEDGIPRFPVGLGIRLPEDS